MPLQLVLSTLAAYLLCSIPCGKIIAFSVARIDITQKGSGNIGATNVARELGIGWGLITLLLDTLKGFAPVFVFAHLAPHSADGAQIGPAVVGLAAVIGHQFSLFERFRGGKGVATALGVYLAFSPLAGLLAAAVFFLVVYKWDYVSLGSMTSALTVPAFMFILHLPPALVVSALITSGLICLKHRENIKRLLHREERHLRHKRVQDNRSSSLSNSSSE